ncbi:MAG: AI-2E family transporter [Candidatus Nanoarchaeia archaeon]
MAIDKSLVNVLLIIGALAAGFLLLRPFFTALAFAAVIAFILYKPHKWLRKKIPEILSAGLLTAFILGLIITIIAVGVNALLKEIGQIFILASEFRFEKFLPEIPELATTLQSLTRLVLQKIIESTTSFIAELPKIILSLFVFTVSVFFFLLDGEKLYKWVERIFPLSGEKKAHMFRDLSKYANSFLFVWFLIGIIQGAVAIVGFILFDLPAPLLAGIAAAVFSILPVLGPGTLYIPTAALLYLRGDISAAVGILVYGLAIGGFLDYVIRPYFAGKWSAIHPLMILTGMLGGVLVMGPAGFIVGPAALVVIVSILHGAGLEFRNSRKES